MHSIGIDHVNLGFPSDRLDEVIDFYVETLGFETAFDDPYAAVADDPGLFTLELGETSQLFVNPVEAFDPEATNLRHVALRIPESPDDLRTFLGDEGVEIDSTADRESDQFGPYTSYYVTDPFGYTVELMAVGE
jgi:catechol 2,3-dioxygenase-like lactoylglutathione lyase family enzyme